MSEGKSSSSGSGIGLAGVMLVLAYGPLNWTFPHWLWWLAAGLPIIIAGFFALLGLFIGLFGGRK